MKDGRQIIAQDYVSIPLRYFEKLIEIRTSHELLVNELMNYVSAKESASRDYVGTYANEINIKDLKMILGMPIKENKQC